VGGYLFFLYVLSEKSDISFVYIRKTIYLCSEKEKEIVFKDEI
jgi:hypothetical protein